MQLLIIVLLILPARVLARPIARMIENRRAS